MLLAQLIQEPSVVHDYGPALVAFAGLIINALILFGAAKVAAGRRDADIESLKTWTDNHEHDSRQRDEAISALKELAATQRAVAAGQDRRIIMLEDERRPTPAPRAARGHDAR